MDHPSSTGINDAIERGIDYWDAGECIAFLEADGSEAPEYDLETEHGIALLRKDCKLLAAEQEQAA